ncbi:hypothetical protein nbrc107696_29890 [Gordonia spumicola]|uniref:Pyrrolo-quinoline quinone repeat domain-containing protein n=1 Tax=Gordonia spumicola TaxID=589161 RepID=A0A7I9VBP8_9ACTN|nr:PQQ-binding-like beta-propeller repeat protein [Gordonia spumicola]GEE02543.1 hypothetical protein nbrc107696_29890 [Gordonia spumicola]
MSDADSPEIASNGDRTRDGLKSLVPFAAIVGLLAASAVFAAYSLMSADTGADSSFAPLRIPLAVAVMTAASVGCFGAWVAWRGATPESGRFVRTAALSALAALVLGAASYGMFATDTFTGFSHTRAVNAVAAAIIALGALAMAGEQLTDRPTRAPTWVTAVAGLVVLAVVGAAVAVGRPPASPDGQTEISVDIGDLTPWPSVDPPKRISTSYTRVATSEKHRRGDDDYVTRYQLGHGYLTDRFEMVNAATGTVRWRIDTPTDRPVRVVVVDGAGLAVVIDADRPGGRRATAIDAETGAVRWTSDQQLTTWQTGGVAEVRLLDEGVLTGVSDDAHTLTAFSPKNGQPTWSHRVEGDCVIRHVDTRPRLAAVVSCPGLPNRMRFLDADAGRMTSQRDYDRGDFSSMRLLEIADRFDRTEPSARTAGVTDLASGRRTLTFAPDERLDSCTAAADCLMVARRYPDVDRASRIVSLTGARPDVRVAQEAPTGLPMWLDDQVVWVIEPEQSTAHRCGLTIVDRRTGHGSWVPDVCGDLFVVDGAVIVATDAELYRFEGADR